MSPARIVTPFRPCAPYGRNSLPRPGITAKIQVVPTDVYYGAQNLWMEADFAITDWGSRSSPQPYLDLAFECGAIWNESYYCDPQLDQLAKQAKTEMDHSKRVELITRFSKYLHGAGANHRGLLR